MLHAKVTSKGQLTLPKAVRESLSIHKGDRIEFSIGLDKGVMLRRLQPSGSSAGCAKAFLGDKRKKLTREEEKALMLNEVGAKYGNKP